MPVEAREASGSGEILVVTVCLLCLVGEDGKIQKDPEGIWPQDPSFRLAKAELLL